LTKFSNNSIIKLTRQSNFYWTIFKWELWKLIKLMGEKCMEEIRELIKQLEKLDSKGMYNNDFLLTWEKTDDELQAVFKVADILRKMRENNISPRIFDSGLAVSLFRDNSTRTRFSFSSACNLLGLTVQDLDEGKS